MAAMKSSGLLPAALRATLGTEKEDEGKSLRFVADFQLNDTDEVMQIPITRPGRGAKVWKRAAAKLSEGTGKAIGSQHSDENLSEILVRVGTYFGRDPNVWTREGEQRTEVVEEGGKRVVKRMQKFMGWKLSLKLMMPLYDPRLKPVEGRPELDFSVESMMIADNDVWNKVIADQPWTSQEARRRVCRLLEAKMLSPEVDLQLEGLHGVWEMVVNKEHHVDITPLQMQTLLDAVMHEDIQCAAVATAAIWTMAAAQKARVTLLEKQVLGKLVQAAERAIRAEDTGKMPAGSALGSMRAVNRPHHNLSRPATAEGAERPNTGPTPMAHPPPVAEEPSNPDAEPMEAEAPPEPEEDFSVWAQYQECVLGAFGVLFVDRAARERYVELDPDLAVLVRLSQGEVHPESPNAGWVAHRKSLAARSLCMLAHRDPAVRMHIVKQAGTMNNILSLMDMPATQPGAAHVKLCMITVLAIMVLDDPCMEYIRTSRKAHPVFSACLRVLQEVLDMLTPGTAVYRMIPEPRVCLAMAEGLAQAVWGAAYDCCLPGGGNITDEEVGRLSALSFQAMALQRSGLDAGRVIRCLTCTLANMAANEGLAGVMMRSRAKTPPPPDSNEPSDADEDYYGYAGQASVRERPQAEAPAVPDAERDLEPDPSGAGAFLLSMFGDLEAFEEKDECDVRTSLITAVALLSGHSFASQGEESMWGPFRESLLHMGAFEKTLHALNKPIRDPIIRELCEIAASYALMQLSTMVGEVDPETLRLYVRIMHDKKANVELVEYMMAGMWILLRTDANRSTMNSIEMEKSGTTEGAGRAVGGEGSKSTARRNQAGSFLGDLDQQLELSAAIQESEASLQKAEQAMRSAEASIQSMSIRPSAEPSIRSIKPKSGSPDTSRREMPTTEQSLASVPEGGSEVSGAKHDSPAPSGEASLARAGAEGAAQGQGSAAGGGADGAEGGARKEGAMEQALSLGAAMASGGQSKGEWGLQVILDVGFTWVGKLQGVGSDGDEDAPLVKLFEFLVSGLGLLMTDADVVPRTEDAEVYEVARFSRPRPLYRDPRGLRTRRQLREDEGGDVPVGYMGMTIHPPEQQEELTESFSKALELLVELLALKEPVTAKIIQLTINSLWGVVLANQFAERRVLDLGATPRLLAICRNAALPPKVRDSSAGMLCDLYEYFPNHAHMGGITPTLRTFVHLVQTGVPLLEHRGALSLGRAAYRAPAQCDEPGFQIKVRRKVARVGGVRALVGLVQHTHSRYQTLLEMGSLQQEQVDPTEANAKKLARMFDRVQGQLKTIHKAHKKQGQDGLGGAQQIDYANREMTMIKALVVNRNNKEAMASVDAGLEVDSMDFYDAIVETQVLALKALLNVSTYPKNQVRIAKAGLLTLLGVNSFFSAMLQTSPPGTPEEEILVLSSKVLQNVALHPLNRTRLYQAELAGAVRKVEVMAEGKLAAKGLVPIWGPLDKKRTPLLRSPSHGGKALRRGKGDPQHRSARGLHGEQKAPVQPGMSSMSLGESLRVYLPLTVPKGKAPTDSIPLAEIQRPKVMFPPIDTRSPSALAPTAPAVSQPRDPSLVPQAWRGTGPTKDRFADWATQTFPARNEDGRSIFYADSSDSDDELGKLEEERELRLQLPALNQSLRKPLSHMWELPPEHPLRHGKARWNPRVSEYVQSSTSDARPVHDSAVPLLTVKDPNRHSPHLMTASLELSQTGQLPAFPDDAVVTGRPATPDRGNGRVPLVRFLPEKELPLAMALSKRGRDNRRARAEADKLDDVMLKVQLAPNTPRTCIGFEATVKDSRAPLRGRPRLTMFEHRHGALVYESQVEPYLLPNGRSAFFYFDPGDMHDEVPVKAGARPQRPSTFPSALQRHMPLAALLDVISKPPGSGVDIVLLKPLPQLARLPSMHTLPVRNPEVLEAWAFGDLEEINLHFVLMVERTVREDTDIAVHEVEAPRPKTPWRLPESIFKPRLKEADSKGFFDTHQIEDRNFERNWKRMTSKEKFMSFLEREARGQKDKDVKALVRDLQKLLRKHYAVINAVFTYYAIVGGGSPYTMELNDFTSLLETCNVPDKESELCKKSDCDTVFIQCNFQENKNSMEAKVATEHSMLRHEFLEAVIRLGVNKYGKGQQTTEVVEAVETILENNLLALVPEAAKLEANHFRRERLYFEEVDLLLKRFKKELTMLYIRYRLPPKGGGLRPKLWKQYCWEGFVNDANLIDDTLSIQQSLLSFAQSRMMVADEIAQWAKYETMTFVDFLEALGRVADMKSWPSVADVNAMGYDDMLQWRLACESGEVVLQRRPSMELSAPKTRPLWVKLEALLNYIFRRLMYVPGEPMATFSMDAFYKKMKKIDHDLGS